ncbi:MAG: CRISPR-associated endonuclease Cas2 [Planctomycetes bacterium]|nr:CRISPR-associated endonuclease Cas2 [Planctomycetota bacterium]MBI3843134.1 CRISPR-associated endonuclease Cas2 [Planctomycetota bacterium]
MKVVVSYDVNTRTREGRRRLRRVGRACQDYGQRVQFSVFECDVGDAEWTRLRLRLLQEYREEEDSLRFYFLGEESSKRIEHHGVKETIDFEGPLLG